MSLRMVSNVDLAGMGRLYLHSNTAEARAVREEMQRRIDACPTYPDEEAIEAPCYTVQDLRRMAMTGEKPEQAQAYVIDYGSTRRE